MNKTQHEYYMVSATYKTKRHIESLYDRFVDFKWLKTKPLDSFKDDRNRVELHVLEGEPPRGFILVNYRLGTVIGLDMQMKQCVHTCVL